MANENPVYLVTSGDLRLAVNQFWWPAQKAFEEALISAVQSLGRSVRRAHPEALAAKSCCFHEPGIEVVVCGEDRE